MSKDTTAEIHKMLAERYSGHEWAYMVEAPDGTGMKKQRTADAIAVGLWAKNAGQFHGFEVKSSRADWTGELQKPEKSQSWRNVCSSFWLVAGRGVAKIEEIPPDWGFLEVVNGGGSLRIRKQPAHVPRESVPLNVVGAILRRAIDQVPFGVAEKLRDVDSRLIEARENGRKIAENGLQWHVQQHESLEDKVRAFEKLTGMNLHYMKPDDLTIQILKTAKRAGISSLANSLKIVANRLNQIKGAIDAIDSDIQQAATQFGKIEEMTGAAAGNDGVT